ncbi:hypothetical protein Tco_0811832 [Tanacetum coccineum]
MLSSKTYQQSLTDAGSETRTPMLERGSYIPWASRFRRYLNQKRDNRKWLLKALDKGPYEFKNFVPEGSTIPRLKTAEDLEGDDLLLHDAEMEVMNMILFSIPNEIYNLWMLAFVAKDIGKRNVARNLSKANGVNATSRVKRPMSKDSSATNSVLVNSKKAAKNVSVYVRKDKQKDNTSANVISNKTFSTNSRTQKSLETTYVAPKTRFSKKETQSKTLDTTSVVSKSKIDVESASKAKDKADSTGLRLVLLKIDHSSDMINKTPLCALLRSKMNIADFSFVWVIVLSTYGQWMRDVMLMGRGASRAEEAGVMEFLDGGWIWMRWRGVDVDCERTRGLGGAERAVWGWFSSFVTKFVCDWGWMLWGYG